MTRRAYCCEISRLITDGTVAALCFGFGFSFSLLTIVTFRLEELRRLNYSLDVELQRERTGRMKLEQKVMSPRSAQASRMLPQSDSSDR